MNDPRRAFLAPTDRPSPAGSQRGQRARLATHDPALGKQPHAGIAALSGIAMKAVAARSSTCHATILGSPQARPAITVSSSPGTAVGLPSSALANRQAARSGSTTMSSGRGRKRSRNCTETAAATPPTPPWIKTCVGGFAPPLIGRLIRHDAIALHDQPRHFGIATPGCIRDQQSIRSPAPDARPRAPRHHSCRRRDAPLRHTAQ